MAESQRPAKDESMKSLLQRLDAAEGDRPVGEMSFANLAHEINTQAPSPAPQRSTTPPNANNNTPVTGTPHHSRTPRPNLKLNGGSAKAVAALAATVVLATSTWLWATSPPSPTGLFANADVTGPKAVIPPAKTTPPENTVQEDAITQNPTKQRLALATSANLLKSADPAQPANAQARQATDTKPATETGWETTPVITPQPPPTSKAPLEKPKASDRLSAAPLSKSDRIDLVPPNAATTNQPASQVSTPNTAPETRLVAAATNALGDWLFESNKQRTQIELKAEPFIESKSGRDIKLPFTVKPTKAHKDIASIVLRGLPKDYAVSSASRVGDGSWIIVPSSLPRARLSIPQSATHPVDLDISIFSVEAELLAHRRVQITITPEHVSRSLKAQDTESLIARGSQLFNSGDIAGARLVYERAAEGGSAKGAYALGTTYDPSKLIEKGVLGMSGDIDKARQWYARAQRQGIPEATLQLQNLPAQ